MTVNNRCRTSQKLTAGSRIITEITSFVVIFATPWEDCQAKKIQGGGGWSRVIIYAQIACHYHNTAQDCHAVTLTVCHTMAYETVARLPAIFARLSCNPLKSRSHPECELVRSVAIMDIKRVLQSQQ